ncbi:LIP1 Lipase, partial [Acromyrmex charruanus]
MFLSLHFDIDIIAFLLADKEYDVWLGNARGNSYFNTHTSDKIKPKTYWNFSWHEIGIYDFPATIDYIVKTIGRKKIFYVGHSQGTSTFFFMVTERPKYYFWNALLPIIFGQFPDSVSTKQLIHYGQLINSGKFRFIPYHLL